MIAAINASNVVEIILAIVGIIGAITSFSFFLANLKIRAQINQQILTLIQRQQRQYDRLKILLNLQLARLKDIESFLEKDGFRKRSEFPEEGLPSENTDI